MRGARRPPPTRLRAGGADAGVWKEAYDVELQRNGLLRDQLRDLSSDAEAPGAFDPSDLEECAVDWEGTYERISECNRALEQQVQELQGRTRPKEEVVDLLARVPVVLTVPLPRQGGNAGSASVELLRFLGSSSSFFALTASLPLGLNLTKETDGALNGAFLVRDVLPGGSAAASGQVVEGDVLQAMTIVPERMDMGVKTEDFASTFVARLSNDKQAVVDACFFNTATDLVDALRSNAVFGDDGKLVLVFERSSEGPEPSKMLEPTLVE